MAHSKIEKSNVDIYEYPTINVPNVSQLSLGDLHANFMFLIHFLTSNGVVKISEQNYQKLKDIYLKSELQKSDIKEFNQIIEVLEVGEKPLIRLIGDEICDRGQNDYFIFKILDKLKKIGVKTEILLSNHGIEFLIPYEQGSDFFPQNIGSLLQIRSMNRMRILISKGVIKRKDIETLVADSYLSSLRLISYSLHNEDITLYSHAGIGLETVQALAIKFEDQGVLYKDDTAEDLAQTIDAINQVFQQYIQKKTAHTLAVNIQKPYDFMNDPVSFLIWNRSYDQLRRDKHYKGYQIYFVHGHDSGEQTQDNIFNLDNPSFKDTAISFGSYVVLGSQCNLIAALEETMDERVDLENPFYRMLNKLSTKAKTLKKDGHMDAYTKAIDIYNALNKTYKTLQEGGDYDVYKNTCAKIIAENRPVLDKHRGWSEFLTNLALAICTFGVGVLIKGGYNLTQKRRFFFVHKTKTGKIVDEIQNKLDLL